MEVKHSARMDFEPTALSHRQSGLAFKELFLGQEQTPENYSFNLARQHDFFSPRHRHNFDQFRYATRGDFSFGPGLTLKEGDFGYFTEGVHYGPQDDDNTEREMLVLQFGGTSGSGYLSFNQLLKATEALNSKGSFSGGKFTSHETGRIQDSYEALWEFMNQKPLVYPKPRYEFPILVHADSFGFYPCTIDCKNASQALLGIFTERGIVAQKLKIESNGYIKLLSPDDIQLFFVLSGTGAAGGIGGDTEIEAGSAIRVQPKTKCVFSCGNSDELVVLHYKLPMVHTDDLSG